MLVLGTALPIEFAQTIEEALGRPPARPSGFEGLEDKPRRVQVMTADVDQVTASIAAHAPLLPA